MKVSDPEFRLQCVIADFCRFAVRDDVVWFAVPNGEKRSKVTAARIKRMGGLAGVGDLEFLIDGKACFLELKLPNDPVRGLRKTYQSTDQRRFQADWEAAGGFYEIARTLDEAKDILGRWNALKSTRYAQKSEAA